MLRRLPCYQISRPPGNATIDYVVPLTTQSENLADTADVTDRNRRYVGATHYEEINMGGYIYAPDAEPGSADIDAIHNACLDYIEGWYTADPDRMRRSLHPDYDQRGMVRRVIDTRAEIFTTQPMTATGMIRLTELGVGRTDPDDRRIEVEILEATHHLASTKVTAHHAIDLLHLMKFPEGWKIVQSTWSLADGVVANMTTDV